MTETVEIAAAGKVSNYLVSFITLIDCRGHHLPRPIPEFHYQSRGCFQSGIFGWPGRHPCSLC